MTIPNRVGYVPRRVEPMDTDGHRINGAQPAPGAPAPAQPPPYQPAQPPAPPPPPAAPTLVGQLPTVASIMMHPSPIAPFAGMTTAAHFGLSPGAALGPAAVLMPAMPLPMMATPTAHLLTSPATMAAAVAAVGGAPTAPQSLIGPPAVSMMATPASSVGHGLTLPSLSTGALPAMHLAPPSSTAADPMAHTSSEADLAQALAHVQSHHFDRAASQVGLKHNIASLTAAEAARLREQPQFAVCISRLESAARGSFDLSAFPILDRLDASDPSSAILAVLSQGQLDVLPAVGQMLRTALNHGEALVAQARADMKSCVPPPAMSGAHGGDGAGAAAAGMPAGTPGTGRTSVSVGGASGGGGGGGGGGGSGDTPVTQSVIGKRRDRGESTGDGDGGGDGDGAEDEAYDEESVGAAAAAVSAAGSSAFDKEKEKRRRSLGKKATEVLTLWFFSHLSDPYPSEEEKARLCRECNMTLNQINNWFGNKRMRYKRKVLGPTRGGNGSGGGAGGAAVGGGAGGTPSEGVSSPDGSGAGKGMWRGKGRAAPTAERDGTAEQ